MGAQLKQELPKNAILVGQNIDSDIAWMKLTCGVDFADKVDIAQFFKGYNARYGNYCMHSLEHEARVLLGKTPPMEAHDPAWDAQESVELYKKAIGAEPGDLLNMQQMLIAQRPFPSIAKRNNYQLDGVCMAKFMPKFCICGQPCS